MKNKLLIPLVIGLTGFFLVVGLAPLNVNNIGWLSRGDALFNYVGWATFRNAPWSFPLGLNPFYGLELGSSIVFSDSIPILAIFFKLLLHFYAEPFQYFGIWLLACFVLQAYFGFKLAELLTSNYLIQCCISSIYLFTPVMLYRVNAHLALAGHFLILWALYLNLQRKNLKIWIWPLLLSITLGVHFYLFSMIFALWMGSLLDRLFASKKSDLKTALTEALLAILSIAFCAWQYGYLVISAGSSAAIGYGSDAFNLLAFFNTLGWSQFIRGNIFSPPTVEGFAYLGGGVVLSMILGIPLLFRQEIRAVIWQKIQRHKYLLWAVIILLLVAITNNVDIGNSHYTFPINEKLLAVLSILRSSIRLTWPIQYLLLFACFWLVVNGYQNRLYLIFCLLAVVQVVDTSRGWINIRNHFRSFTSLQIETPLIHEFWKQVPKKYSIIRVNPPHYSSTLSAYAANNKMATNAVFLARADARKLEETTRKNDADIASGKFNSQTLYILQNWKDNLYQPLPKVDADRDLFAKIDNFIVIAPNYKVCSECKQVDQSLEVKSFVPEFPLGAVVKFGKEGIGGKFLLSGWAHAESWGSWSLGQFSTFVIPLNGVAPSQIQIDFRGLVGPNHPLSEVKVFINDLYLKTFQIKKQLGNHIELDVPSWMRRDRYLIIKFEYLNPASPKNVYGNSDDRRLTLGIESVRVFH